MRNFKEPNLASKEPINMVIIIHDICYNSSNFSRPMILQSNLSIIERRCVEFKRSSKLIDGSDIFFLDLRISGLNFRLKCWTWVNFHGTITHKLYCPLLFPVLYALLILIMIVKIVLNSTLFLLYASKIWLRKTSRIV